MGNRVIIDIESFGTKPSMNDLVAPKNYKKQEAIDKWKEENFDAVWRKRALDKFNCTIVCLSAYYPLKDASFSMACDSEEEILKAFSEWLFDTVGEHQAMALNWVGAYVGEFDLPIIRLRSIKYGLKKLTSVLPFKPFSGYTDVFAQFLGTSRKDSVSLKTLLKYFGLEGKLDGIDGSCVHDFVLNKEFDKIDKYCMTDVMRTYELSELLN